LDKISTRNYIKVSESALRQYQNKNAIREVVGCLIKNPQLLKTYKFDKKDFVESFHQVLYVTIHNMARDGAEKIDAYAVDAYLKESFPFKHSIFTKH
jgi:replicative DNA helicase